MDAIEFDGGESSAGDGPPSDSHGGVSERILVDADRLYLTVGGAAVVLLCLLLLYRFDLVAFTNQNSLTRMASGMIAGSFSLVTLVVSVNQLILSQELSSAGEYRDKLEGVMSFRRDVEEATGASATPQEPAEILGLLVETIDGRAEALAAAATESGDEAHEETVIEFTRDIREATERIEESLDAGHTDTFEVLSSAISFDNGRRFHDARYVRNEYDLSEAEDDALDGLVTVLKLFEAGQHYFKTVYLQRELTRFSQLTIYSGVPAIGAAVLIIVLYGATGGMTLSPTYFPYVIVLLSTVVLIPVALLASYVLRITTLTRRTATIGPTTL